MSEQAKYPARGQMSDDGKVYTDKDGAVHEVTDTNWQDCTGCTHDFCGPSLGCKGGWHRIKGAYVPSSEEVAACDMARAMIEYCEDFRSLWECGENHSPTIGRPSGCICCPKFANKSCPARVYLAAHGDATAWEVK